MSFAYANKFFIDYDTSRGYVPTRGPFDSLEAARADWDTLPHELRFRLRGPDNKIYAESNLGNVFIHDPPRSYR